MSEVSTGAQDEDPMVRDVTQWLADNPATPEPAGDLVERVADAIAKADRVPPDEPDIYWAHLAPPDEPDIYWAHLARAAIDAMPDHAALDIQAQTYRDMHAQAVELGYPSILEALEATDYMKEELATLRTQLAASQADVARLREALQKAESAIAEYYRYWTGGEARGSYDGKPERKGLWDAQRLARAAIKDTRS